MAEDRTTMNQVDQRRRSPRPALAVAVALLCAGCPGDDGGSPGSATAGEETTTSSTEGTGDDEPAPPETTSGSTSESPSSTGTEPPDGSTSAAEDGFCGDGQVDLGEECDLGPENADDGECTSTCENAVCGDGLLHAEVEECDDGLENSDDGVCTQDCKLNVCGDGKRLEGVEECDDPDKGEGYGQCTWECTWGPHCGDGILQPEYEECDGGDAPDPAKCSAECTILSRVIFVSSELYTGDLGGLSGANTKCQVLAAAAKLPHPETFRAWLSSDNASPSMWIDGLNPALRYQTPSGATIAESWAALTSGMLKQPINQNEKMETIGDGQLTSVWTGTAADGSSKAPNCAGWTKAEVGLFGRKGQTLLKDVGWTDAADHKCQ